MQYWLFKTEPTAYSLADLKREKKALWTGVRNAMARIHLRNVRRGDKILLYHTGSEKAIVGVTKAVSGPQPDATNDDPKSVAVEVEFLKEFAKPVTLSQIKKDRAFSQFGLVRNSRLSVMPVSEKEWRQIEQLTGE
jgi:predicted RNA-binding protein with PUA-like domain